MLLYCLPRFDPEQETEFLKYAKHYIRDGLLFCRMIGEAGSFASLAEYRRVRQIGAIYNNSGKSRAEVVSEFAAQSGYKDESASADELLTIARRNRSIVSLYRTEQDEGGEETGNVAGGSQDFGVFGGGFGYLYSAHVLSLAPVSARKDRNFCSSQRTSRRTSVCLP